MQKSCKCGKVMHMVLRSVMYSNKVEIKNVPIYSCDECSHSEVFPAVKNDLTKLIDQLGSRPQKQQLAFNECNEFAYLMYNASDKDQLGTPVEVIIEERVNQLLDMLIMARSLEDEDWVRDIQNRLKQITEVNLLAYDIS